MITLFTTYTSALLDMLSHFISSDFGIMCIIGSVFVLCVWKPLMRIIKL